MNFYLPQDTIFYQLERSIKLYRKLAQTCIDKSGHDISINQLILVINLSEHPTITQLELANYIHKDLASVTRMIDILVKKAYLLRTENVIDRRKKDLVPTSKCQKMLKELKPVINKYRKLALLNITNNQLNQFNETLNQFIVNCENGLNDPS